jgi:hypothetical protein
MPHSDRHGGAGLCGGGAVAGMFGGTLLGSVADVKLLSLADATSS